jgi:hypothetical protein
MHLCLDLIREFARVRPEDFEEEDTLVFREGVCCKKIKREINSRCISIAIIIYVSTTMYLSHNLFLIYFRCFHSFRCLFHHVCHADEG